jgi:hypothetical protein
MRATEVAAQPMVRAADQVRARRMSSPTHDQRTRPGKISYVQIGMLGPFEVRMDDGVFAEVPGARLRGLLIALALEPGHVVPKATLVDWIEVSVHLPTRRMPCNAWPPGCGRRCRKG